MKSNQGGFGVVGGILILAIVAVVGGAGWYVWHNNKNDATSSTVQNITAPKSEAAQTIVFDKSKLPEKWTQITQANGTLELDSSYYGSIVTVKKIVDTSAKTSSENSFIAEYRAKASNATQTTYGNTLLPSGELTVNSNKGSLKLTTYVYEVRDYQNTLLSTHAESFIVRDGYYVNIEETVNSGQSLSNADKTLQSVTFNL